MKEDVWARTADGWLQSVEQHISAVTPSVMTQLGAPEQFVLCNFRLWWTSESPCARAMVRNGFVAVNLPNSAHASFEQFMLILSAAGEPRPLIHAATQPDISNDEARLLSVVALCQQGHNGHAIMILKRWLPATAYRVSLRNLVSFSGMLAVEGMTLPLRLQVSGGAAFSTGSGPRHLMH